MLENLTEQEFNQFSKNHPNSMFFQSSYWGNLKESTGWKKHLVGIKENGKIVGATLLLCKKIPVLNQNMFYAPRGFLLDYQNQNMISLFTKEVSHYVKKNKGIFFKINPPILYQQRNIDGDIVVDGTQNKSLVEFLKKIGYQHNGFTIHYGKDLEPRWVSILNIENQTEEQIFQLFRNSHKRKIKKSLGGWLSLEQVTTDDLEKLEIYKKIMAHTGNRRGFIDRAEDYYKKMYDVFSKDKQIQIVLIRLDLQKYHGHILKELEEITNKIENLSHKKESEKQELTKRIEHLKNEIEEVENTIQTEGNSIYITTGLFMLFGSQLTYLFGGSYDKYMKYFGAYYMQWEMIKYAIQNHYKEYNFYGITGEFNEDSKMYGLFDFKRGFHADVTEYIGEFTYIVNKPYYFLYNRMFTIYKKIKKWRMKK